MPERSDGRSGGRRSGTVSFSSTESAPLISAKNSRICDSVSGVGPFGARGRCVSSCRGRRHCRVPFRGGGSGRRRDGHDRTRKGTLSTSVTCAWPRACPTMEACHAPSLPPAMRRSGPPRFGSRRTPADRVADPDEASVWCFSDVHGVRSGLLAALVEAGIADIDGAWIAPPGTALVGLGDYIDRGAEVRRASSRCWHALQAEAAAAGSRVVLVRGNHEQMLVDLLHGDTAWAEDWLAKGGDEALRSFGMAPDVEAIGSAAGDRRSGSPELAAFVLDTLPYAVWRDVLLVHAAPPTGRGRGWRNSIGDRRADVARRPLPRLEGIASRPGVRGLSRRRRRSCRARSCATAGRPGDRCTTGRRFCSTPTRPRRSKRGGVDVDAPR